MIERMYSLKETAEVLRKSVKTVRRYVQSGMLSARRSGINSVVIPESELERFMEPVQDREELRVLKLLQRRSERMGLSHS